MSKSSIEWTELTWNPTTGCTKVSAGCKFCYAEVMHKRLRGMGQAKYSRPFNELAMHPEALAYPTKITKPAMIFVNSMSDLFHKDVPIEFIKRVFEVMNNTPRHIFQVLTKRSERLLERASELHWTPNIWMGVSVENNEQLDRVEDLKETPAKVKWLSCEPLIGPLSPLDVNGLDWIVVGGESGSKARPMQPDWAIDIRDKCKVANVPFFFKQWGAWMPTGASDEMLKVSKKQSGNMLDGVTHQAFPQIIKL